MSARLLLVLGLASVPATVVAQQSYANRSPTAAVLPALIDPALVAAQLALGEEATQAGRVADARRIYRNLIEDQREADQFAGEAMWRLALNYLYAEDRWHAANTLDELATASNRYGDPAMELRASFEGAVLWQQLKRPELVRERFERAKALLQSPAIPEAQKADIRQRM